MLKHALWQGVVAEATGTTVIVLAWCVCRVAWWCRCEQRGGLGRSGGGKRDNSVSWTGSQQNSATFLATGSSNCLMIKETNPLPLRLTYLRHRRSVALRRVQGCLTFHGKNT